MRLISFRCTRIREFLPSRLTTCRCSASFMSAQVTALRQLLEQRFPDALPLTHRVGARAVSPVETGLNVIDNILPSGGLPRTKLTAWAPYGGARAVLRAASYAAIRAGERAAWIDADGTVGPDWRDGPLLLRPEGAQASVRRTNALRTAEVLLRSGGFALVVLAGAEPEGRETVRLTRAVREGGGAFVLIARSASMASLRITSRLIPHGVRWQHGPFADPAAAVDVRIEVRVRSLGWNVRAEVVLPVSRYELRLSVDPSLADRRGAR